MPLVMPSPTTPLEVETIHKAVDKMCASSSMNNGYSWRRAQKDDVSSLRRLAHSALSEQKLVQDGFSESAPPLYYAIVLENKSGVICGVAIIFMEFSTWEGRVLFVKRMVLPCEDMRVPVIRMLASIALGLDCVRLVWQHMEEASSIYKDMGASKLDGVLTLKMDQAAMNVLLPSQPIPLGSLSVNDAIDAALEPFNVSLQESKLQLKRATVNDLLDIRTLVQGLADHVKESDSISTTMEELRLDGFETPAPLYYCLLLNDTDTGKACGVAVIFFGYDIDSGRFLYLEDLFIEEAYRGNGGGKTAMLALASIAQMLNCGSFVWQALDWNKPSLLFYENLGAKVQQGLLTSRFAGKDLETFAMGR